MNSFAKALSKLSQVGITMVVTIGLCFFIGKWLDEKLGTNVIFLSIFTLLGIGAAFRNLYVMVILDYKKQEEKEKQQNYLIQKDEKHKK